MDTWSWRRFIGRILAAAVLFFVLYFLTDLLFLVLSPLGSHREVVSEPVETFDYWQDVLIQGPQPLTRTVTFSGTATGVSIEFSLWAARTHGRLLDRVTSGSAAEHTSAFVRAAFGTVSVENEELAEEDYASLVWTLDPGSESLHVNVRAFKDTDGRATVSMRRDGRLVPGQDEVVLFLDGVGLHRLSSSVDPEWVTLDQALVQSRAPDTIGWLHFDLEPINLESEAASSQPAHEPRQRFLQRLGDVIDVPLVSRMLYSLVIAAPLVIFWLWVPRHKGEKHPLAIRLAEAVGSLLLFHFVLHFLVGSNQLIRGTDLFALPLVRLSKLAARLFSWDGTPILRLTPSRLLSALFGVVLPGVFSQRAGHVSRRADRLPARVMRAAVVLVLVVGSLAPWGYALFTSYWDQDGVFPETPPMEAVLLPVAVLLTLGVWAVFFVLYRCMAARAPRSGLTLLAALLVLAMAAVDGYAMGAERDAWLPFVWLALAVVLGVSLVVSFFNVVRTQVIPKLQVSRWAGISLGLLAVVLAVPMTKLVNPWRELACGYTVVYLAHRLDEWLIFIWVAGVVYLLYREGRKGQLVGPLARAVGILGLSSLLFNVQGRWLYIPATFLVGWLVLEWWLVRPWKCWQKLRSLPGRVVSERRELLDRILDLNVAESTYKQFRKDMGEKLSSGEIDVKTYDEKLESRKQQIETSRQQATIEGQPVKELVLAFGPYPSAWQNGVHGAKFALLFATPWVLLYMYDFLSNPMSWQTYPLWGFAADLLTVVARWTAYGFLLGYFYPYLHGKNGMSKGLGLFVCSVVASLPLMTVFNTTPEAWQANLFWVLQVFIQCALLGLVAFDYTTMRRNGYDWQMLLEIHGLTGVGVQVSSILTAAGMAVVTLMTTQASTLVTLALKFVLPQVPADLPIP